MTNHICYRINCILLLLLFMGCKPEKMKFEISKKEELKGIPSASAIEFASQDIYVIGDDSPWLFKLNSKLEIQDKFQLLPERSLPDSIYEKVVKPDFEAICSVDSTGKNLLIFGSGSKSPERDIVVEILLSEKILTKEYDLVKFYEHLRTSANLSAEELNIEGAEVVDDQLYLLNRGRNLVFRYALVDFMNHIKGNGKLPEPEVLDFELPKINGIEAGFSGVSYLPNIHALLFTATVEDTANWIDDGEVLGSFLGVIPIKDLGKNKRPKAIAIEQYGEILKIKVESATVLPTVKEGVAEVLLVTDSDGDISEFLFGTLIF